MYAIICLPFAVKITPTKAMNSQKNCLLFSFTPFKTRSQIATKRGEELFKVNAIGNGR